MCASKQHHKTNGIELGLKHTKVKANSFPTIFSSTLSSFPTIICTNSETLNYLAQINIKLMRYIKFKIDQQSIMFDNIICWHKRKYIIYQWIKTKRERIKVTQSGYIYPSFFSSCSGATPQCLLFSCNNSSLPPFPLGRHFLKSNSRKAVQLSLYQFSYWVKNTNWAPRLFGPCCSVTWSEHQPKKVIRKKADLGSA